MEATSEAVLVEFADLPNKSHMYVISNLKSLSNMKLEQMLT